MPLLSSVVDVDLLSQLEDVDPNDPTYISLDNALSKDAYLQGIVSVKKVRSGALAVKNEKTFLLVNKKGQKFVARVDTTDSAFQTKLFEVKEKDKSMVPISTFFLSVNENKSVAK